MIAPSLLIAMPIHDRSEAEAFLDALCEARLDYHFDDGAVDCLYRNKRVTLAEAEGIDRQVERCYAAWRASGADLREDCPIGYVLTAIGV